MEKLEKIIINDKDTLDRLMHFKIGGSWDYIEDRYPALYPVLLVVDSSKQVWDYIYKSDFYTSEELGERPPIGLRPFRFIAESRIKEISEAMCRYSKAGKQIPMDWVNEYKELHEKYIR